MLRGLLGGAGAALAAFLFTSTLLASGLAGVVGLIVAMLSGHPGRFAGGGGWGGGSWGGEAASAVVVDSAVVAAGAAAVAVPVAVALREAGDDPTSVPSCMFAVGTSRVPASHAAGDHRGHRGR